MIGPNERSMADDVVLTPEPATLQDLLSRVEVLELDGDPSTVIAAITHDSRAVAPATLFVAYRGVNLDVHRFLPDAAASGAAACLVERPLAELRAEGLLAPGPVYARVAGSRAARAQAAAALWQHPSEHLLVVGITGTDGKTTTSLLLEAMLRAAGRRPGVVTTVGSRIGDTRTDTGLHVTTGDPEDVQRYLAQMVRAGCDVAVLESTSHGLAQHRVDAVAFDIAVVTNVTREALDYHGTFDAYVSAKARLFEMLLETPSKGVAKTGVMNAADPSYERFLGVGVPTVLTFAVDAPADFHATQVTASSSGEVIVEAETPRGSVRFESSLIGAFNAGNILAAAAAAHALGCDPSSWRDGAGAVGTVPGRMQAVHAGQPFDAFVDFAHTPNGLQVALAAARQHVGDEANVIVVFGCAGLRDPGKRAPMGQVAGELADVIVLTAEDPRTESVEDIIDEISEGVAAAAGRAGRRLLCEPDRMQAIRRAVAIAGPGDIVLVCGKGHEQSMCFGEVEIPWDDRAAVRAALTGEQYGALPTAMT